MTFQPFYGDFQVQQVRENSKYLQFWNNKSLQYLRVN